MLLLFKSPACQLACRPTCRSRLGLVKELAHLPRGCLQAAFVTVNTIQSQITSIAVRQAPFALCWHAACYAALPALGSHAMPSCMPLQCCPRLPAFWQA
jgi:hypothetical protein